MSSAERVLIVAHADRNENIRIINARKTTPRERKQYAQYPEVKILAFSPPNEVVLGADYNGRRNGPENWLPIVFQQVANSADGSRSNKASTSGAV